MPGHIALYVNEFSLDYGSEGRMAIETRRRGGVGTGTGRGGGERPRSCGAERVVLGTIELTDLVPA